MPTQTFTDGSDTFVLTTTADVDTLEFLGGDDIFTFNNPNIFEEAVTA